MSLPKPKSSDLLTWYDRHRRDLPWRAKAGAVADPYRVWLSEIMLQQTTVTAVKPYYAAFLDRFPDIQSLAQAPTESVMQAWAGLGYYSRARNLHACAKTVSEQYEGRFPKTAAALRELPGIGAYTAGAIAAIAFGAPEAAVDGNVERVMARLYRIEETPLKAKAEILALAQALVPPDRPGDFAQALMDLGATLCTPKRPACGLCPWLASCQARCDGLQEDYPKKEKKLPKISRRGAAFVALRADNSVLLRTRPPTGLLGGMVEVPGTAWDERYDVSKAMLEAPLEARWSRLEGTVRHVFTHFPLELTVFFAKVGQNARAAEDMRWVARQELDCEALPGVMRKVLAHALGAELRRAKA